MSPERCPDVRAERSDADAMGLSLVKRPWDLHVLVTGNMLGGVLADTGDGPVGGMGPAPSGDIGETRGGRLLAADVERAFREGDLVPFELGDDAGTGDVAEGS